MGVVFTNGVVVVCPFSLNLKDRDPPSRDVGQCTLHGGVPALDLKPLDVAFLSLCSS